jgi:hypothetical protein
MRHRLMFISLPLVALFLALSPTALASSKWYVDGVNGSDNNNCKSRQRACKTIGHAISLASSGDSITVAAATYTENLGISFGLTIVGSSAATTIIDGGGVATVVTIATASAHVSLSKMTIRNGLSKSGGGINNNYNGGTVTLSHITISGNRAYVSCQKYCGSYGGGISNLNGTMTINNSTISGNTASSQCQSFCFPPVGGGIDNGGTLTINNSTISGNSADSAGSGGGIANGGTLTINNSTISGNGAYGDGALGPLCGMHGCFGTVTISNSSISGNSASYTGGIGNGRGTTLQNSIVANNSGGNCYGTMTSNGYNLSSDGTCNFNNTGDLNNTDPKLGQLGNYGGPTQTIPLLSGSPAIDEGNPSGCTDGQGHLLKTDQRGKPRHDKEDTGGCDMGAYERQKD